MALKQSSYDVDRPALDMGAVREITGSLDASSLRFGLVVSRYNATLTAHLAETAILTLRESGAKDENITLVWVPGAYEVSSVVHKLAVAGRHDALIALGVVIQGETPHAGLINNQVSLALAQVSREQNVPVIDGVVPAQTEEQAAVRCDPARGARGRYLAYAAIEMAHVFHRLDEGVS